MNAPDGTKSLAPADIALPLKPVSEEIVIGKDILELLTGAMYSDPLTIFREYVQNSTDAIEDAVATGLLATMQDGIIELELDGVSRSIRIRDNGIGIPVKEFAGRLTAIGMSKKRGRKRRGFRGVGRLSGLGYCQEMVFRSKSADDAKPREMVWDGRMLKSMLRDSSVISDLGETIRRVASVRSISPDGYPDHFFEVELRGVLRLSNDLLLDEQVVQSYLSQVAPVAFAPGFSWGAQIEAFLARHSVEQSVRVQLKKGSPIFKPHARELRVSKTATSRPRDVETFELGGLEGEVAAVGWILHHDYPGAISSASAVGGLRIRSGNIQVGDETLLEDTFPESRFNSWAIGEIHILSPRIVPNGRRDGFEANIHWERLVAQVESIAVSIARRCRSESRARVAARRGQQLYDRAQQALLVARMYSKLGFGIEVLVKDLEKIAGEISKLAGREDKGLPIHQTLRDLQTKLKGQIGGLKTHPMKSNPLEFLPANQRTTFKTALELVLTLSADRTEASRLVQKIILHARRANA